ncbi:MAG: Gfo/Idh/MocA family oxidoreductase [Anaerolineae bacterium]|nr:Gfo/Idh/MocA family oxidoreductase [Anaerolineae bacterium]
MCVRIGFIGAGGIARAHMRRLLEIPEARVVALADPDPTAISRMIAAFPQAADLPIFANYREMLSSIEMDAVEIHTPHTLHFQQGMDVLNAGKHLLMEKPMVCSVAHAKQLIAAAKEKEKILMVSYQRHFQGPYLYIRKQVTSGNLGRIQFVSALLAQNWLRSQRGKWRQIKALSGGGQLNDSGSHVVDILLWTTGLEAESVFAYIQNYDTEVDIDSAISIRFSNGAQGTLSIIGDSPMWWEEFSIWGSKGALLYRNGTLLQRNFQESETREITQFPPNSSPDKNFVDAILGRDIVRVPPECGLRVIELTEAAWKSAELARPVYIQELAQE